MNPNTMFSIACYGMHAKQRMLLSVGINMFDHRALEKMKKTIMLDQSTN